MIYFFILSRVYEHSFNPEEKKFVLEYIKIHLTKVNKFLFYLE